MLRSRIAPTPSGYLHAGNAASFLLTWLITRTAAGSLLLRIDDLDAERSRPEYIEDIFRSLEWLGIRIDEGPSGPGEFNASWSQHLRMSSYHEFLDGLIHQKHLIFGCQCSRSVLPYGSYPGTCISKEIPLTTPNISWRINLGLESSVVFNDLLLGRTEVDLKIESGPFLVRGRNGRPMYQVASLVDDLGFNINFIVRGSDLIPSTACQLYLDAVGGSPHFSRTTFLHHPLLIGADNSKLSKSAGAYSLKSFRERGGEVIAVYRTVAHWLGVPLSCNDIRAAEEQLQVRISSMLRGTPFSLPED